LKRLDAVEITQVEDVHVRAVGGLRRELNIPAALPTRVAYDRVTNKAVRASIILLNVDWSTASYRDRTRMSEYINVRINMLKVDKRHDPKLEFAYRAKHA
jgi:hypothetical protein